MWSARPNAKGLQPDAWARVGEGVVTTSSSPDRPSPRIVVLDIETRDPQAVEILLRRYGESPLSVRTRRGVHLYYREPDGVEVKTNAFQAVRHDIKSRKALCHLPGSAFAGGCYEAFLNNKPLDAATLLAKPEGILLDVLPTFNVAALEVYARECGFRHPAWRRADGIDHVLSDSEARERGQAYLSAAGPARAGDGGHNHTRGVLLRLGDIGVPERIAAEIAAEWDKDNEPPWGEKKIREMVADAYATRHTVIGCRARGACSPDGDDDVDLSGEDTTRALADAVASLDRA